MQRVKIQELFKCGSLTSAVRALNDIKIQYRKQNLDRLIDKDTMLGIETQCIVLGDQRKVVNRDEDLIAQILKVLEQIDDMNQVSLQSRKRLAHIIQIIIRVANKQLNTSDDHEYTNSLECVKCRRSVKCIFVEQSGLKESTSVKNLSIAYDIMSKNNTLLQMIN